MSLLAGSLRSQYRQDLAQQSPALFSSGNARRSVRLPSAQNLTRRRILRTTRERATAEDDSLNLDNSPSQQSDAAQGIARFSRRSHFGSAHGQQASSDHDAREKR